MVYMTVIPLAPYCKNDRFLSYLLESQKKLMVGTQFVPADRPSVFKKCASVLSGFGISVAVVC